PFLLVSTAVVSLGLTLAMMFFSFSYVVDLEEDDFDAKSQLLDQHISKQLEDMRDELRGLSIALSNTEKVEEDTLRFNTEHTFAQHSAVLSALVAVKVKQARRESFIMSQQQEVGVLDYQITDKLHEKRVVSSPRSVYYPINFIEPFDVDHVMMLGTDIFANPQLTVALQVAMARGLDIGRVLDLGLGEVNLWLFSPLYSGFAYKAQIESKEKNLRMINGFMGIEVDLRQLLIPDVLHEELGVSYTLSEDDGVEQASASILLFQIGSKDQVSWWKGFALSHLYHYPLQGQHIDVRVSTSVSWFASSFWLFFLSGMAGLGFTGVLMLSMRALLKSEA
ncbi:MAG: CHASE domain-containing protein, partial [Ghiorsea sp.]